MATIRIEFDGPYGIEIDTDNGDVTIYNGNHAKKYSVARLAPSRDPDK